MVVTFVYHVVHLSLNRIGWQHGFQLDERIVQRVFRNSPKPIIGVPS